MDIFKFNSPTEPTLLEQGQIVNRLKSKMWIERYDKAGEFKFTANAESGVRETLPIGSYISHVDSTEIMVVENHEISEDRGKETEIIVSGRGFETFFENRIVGSNKTYPTNNGITDYVLASGLSWNQAVTLIEDHILAANLLNDDDEIPNVEVLTTVSQSGTSAVRELKRQDLYSSLLKLLEVDKLGISVVRPGPWSPLSAGSPNIAVVIRIGVDRSSDVIFSYETGEIESADYLWSIKKVKNAAVVSGKWVEVFVTTGETGAERRVMHVDANDIDEAYDTAPTSTNLTNVINAMNQRGLDELAAQKEVALAKAEFSKETNNTAYRKDFDVGDLITVHGNYSEVSKMRITEYVEIEDENGSNGYPTLSLE